MEIVLGPPGTGKTTYLLEQMEGELDRGVRPESIGFVSFTRRAAQEAKDRAKTKFNLPSHRLPWVRTLHSLCFRALGMDKSEVLEGKTLQEFAKYVGKEISTNFSLEEGATFGFSTGDRCLFIDNMARVRCMPLRQFYDTMESGDKINWYIVEQFSDALAEFKRARGLKDYTDMLAEFVEQGWAKQLDVLFVDEAQDLSALQWRVVDVLARGARRVVVAGDDDQAIYRWAGAAVEHFIGLQGAMVTVLDHSWRVPPEVQAVADRIIGKISHRRPKTWNPRDGGGSVVQTSQLEEAGIDTNQDTLILARNTCFLRDDVMPFLHKSGILYEYRNRVSVRQSVVDAIVAWERLRRGGEVMVEVAAKVYEQMEVNIGFAWGHKKLPAYKDREQLVTMQDLKEAGGLLTDAIWHEALTRVTVEERVYMTAVLRGGQKLTEPPKIRISTIHGAKGAQADHVVLLTDMAWRTLAEAKHQPEDEARTWYVAVTRAKQKLTIQAAQNTQRSYDLYI
jgi:DNA helicase-2/ATP-dependent DNA helicase PcrA